MVKLPTWAKGGENSPAIAIGDPRVCMRAIHYYSEKQSTVLMDFPYARKLIGLKRPTMSGAPTV
jgi:hypothetical protein